MTVRSTLIAKLGTAFQPSRLDVIDESARHAGHSGARPEGETHFRIEIVSDSFRGLNRVARERLVHKVLTEELRGRIHALSLALSTPEENAGG